jgi:multicomponent Na+:H+ antiporter subunit B
VSTRIFRTTVRVVVPVILLLSVSLFLRGHNAPGGGFIGGVLTATAFALLYMAYGVDFLETELLQWGEEPGDDRVQGSVVVGYRLLFATGLALALGSGLVPLLFELPFMSQAYRVLHDLPLYGEMELASALAFDLGVYLVVVGGLLTVLSVVGAE